MLSIFGSMATGCMCVFFMISGYVMYLHLERHNYSMSLFLPFLAKRTIRIAIPLLLCIALILAIQLAFQWHLGEPMTLSLSQFLANITLTANFFGEQWYNPIFWTLAVEIQFYLFIALTFVFIRTYPFPTLLGLGMGAFLLNYSFDTRGLFVEFGSYFIIGFALYLYHQKKFNLLQVLILTAIGITDFQLNQGFEFYISSTIFIPIILFVNARSRILEFAGEISFSFYLLHGVIGGWFLYFTLRYADHQWQKIALLIVALIISFGGAYLFYRIIEKTSTAISKRITYKRSTEVIETN